MSKHSVINLIDKLFVTVCVFLLSYAWINFYVRDLWLTFAISLAVCFSVCFVLFYFLNKKQAKAGALNEKKEKLNTFRLSFQILNDKEKSAVLKSAFGLNEKQNEFYLLNGELFYFASEDAVVDENAFFKILAAAKIRDEKVLNIVGLEFAPGLKTNLLKNVKINLIDTAAICEKCEAKNIALSTDKINLAATKFSWKEFLLNLFSPQKAKSYFVCGLVLLFSSILLPFNFYYIIVGSMLMLFAIICKVLKR